MVAMCRRLQQDFRWRKSVVEHPVVRCTLSFRGFVKRKSYESLSVYRKQRGKMSKAHPPELKKFMDKKLSLKLNGGRHVQGILRGFDPFMNLVMDDCLEMGPGGQQNTIGMVVIRGNSIIMLEALERV
ncbi:hypothetical protein Q8A73_014416 [Channa argus]|nr:hypothetical protein Q8A73_014416 [Channa argus]